MHHHQKWKNMRFSDHQYMGKIFQCVQKKLGRSAINATFSMESYKTNVLTWRMFMASSMKAAIHFVSDFLKNSEIYKDTRFENIEDNVQHHSEFSKRTF